jgi:phosphate transport system substrate-binding protein
MEQVIGILGEAFSLDHPEITVTYNPTGSGSGIQAVLDGRCDIALSSRYLKDSEKEQGLTETVLAYDGIAIIVNPENPISDLSLATLRDIYTGTITDWSELGGQAGEIVLIGREAGSGTRDGFESATGTTGACVYRQELTSTGDVITTVASNPNAIGYASLASVKDSVQVVSIDGVIPSEETIRDGSYSVQRPFLLVTLEEKPLTQEALRFTQFATGSDGVEWISRAGVIAAYQN